MQSLSPSRDLQIWKKHQIQRWLEREETLGRVQKQKGLSAGRKEDSKSEESDKEKGRLKPEDIRQMRAREERQRKVRAESSSRLRDAQLKKLQERRISDLQQKMRSNNSRFTEAREVKSHLQLEEDRELTTRLQMLQFRLEKSQELHTAALQSRSQSAVQRRFRLGSASPLNLHESSDRLMEYVKKVQVKREKGTQAKTEELLRRESVKRARMERWKKVETNLKQEKQKVQQWTKTLESKHTSLASTVETRLSANHKSHATRSEHLRELQGLCSLNRERMQRMQTERQTDLMLRWMDKGRRLEELKLQRTLSVQKKREIQRFDMLEREKTYSLLERVAHSPSPVKAHQLLKLLDKPVLDRSS